MLIVLGASFTFGAFRQLSIRCYKDDDVVTQSWVYGDLSGIFRSPLIQMMLFSLGELVSRVFIKSVILVSLVVDTGKVYYEIIIPLLHQTC